MKKTFEELVDSIEYGKDNIVPYDEPYEYDKAYSKNTVVNLMKLVREKTLQECANNNDVDVQWMGWLADQHFLKPFVFGEDYEAYVINSSILNLDKDSIEI